MSTGLRRSATIRFLRTPQIDRVHTSANGTDKDVPFIDSPPRERHNEDLGAQAGRPSADEEALGREEAGDGTASAIPVILSLAMDTMSASLASLERLGALWRQLEHATPGSPEYLALTTQIRAESDAYNALVATVPASQAGEASEHRE